MEIDFSKTTIHEVIKEVFSEYAEQTNISVNRVFIDWYLSIGMPPVVANVEIDASKR